MKRILILLSGIIASALMSTNASAQGGYEVKGVVIDEIGPVMGASIIEKGTLNGTSTDLDGTYTLKVSSADAIVEISCIGYATASFKASAVPSTLTLSDDTTFLEEVVVIGYGTLSKKELSSSIVQVDKDDFARGSMNNVMEMMSGKVAGLNVNTTAAANPNSSSSLQIRGATSITAGNGPLVVIDGVPGGDIRNLSAQDIESMTVLKDAASAAIYGTRGANGVILITTKKGSDAGIGKSHITYDSWVGVNIPKAPIATLSADEFRRSRRGNDYGYTTDWYDEITRDYAYDLNQYVSADGTMENGSYNASINYKRANGIDITSGREEFGGRAAIEQKALDNKFQFNAALNVRRVNETWGDDGMFDTALNLNPTMPVRNEDGSWYQPTTSTGIKNPVSRLVDDISNGQRLYLLGTTSVKWNILSNENHSLSTSLTYSYNYNDLKSNYYTPSTSSESFWGGFAGRASLQYQKWYSNEVEWLVNYMFTKGDHTLSAVAGYAYEDNNWESMYMENSDFANDISGYNSIGSGRYLGEGKANINSGKSRSKLIGVFGRVNYNWKDIIFASASLRYEGSTKFGANNKWGYFPAVSIAADLANTGLFDGNDVVQSLKPRVSYGVTGRSDFDSYLSLSTYSSTGSYIQDGKWVTAYAPSVNANPDLRWEKLVAINVGVDFVLWNRLRGSVDLFDRQSRDLLYTYTAPQPPFVYPTILVNVGTTSNKGVEFTLDYDVVAGKDFSWTTGVNASFGSTYLTKLSNDIYKADYLELYQKPGVGTSEYFFRVAEGSKIGQFYGYEYAGVDENKNMLIYDNEGNKVNAAAADISWKKYIGNGTPEAFVNWNNTLVYKNWDLSLQFSGAFGFQIFNMRKYGMGLQSCGTDNVFRTAYTDDAYITTGGGVISSFFLEDGDYFKLQNATLGYNFTPKNSAISNLRAYISAKNLFTLTKYSGSDPSIVSVTGITPGVDSNSAYPVATAVTLGVTLSF